MNLLCLACLLDLVEGVKRTSLLSLCGFLSPRSPSHFLFRNSRMSSRIEDTIPMARQMKMNITLPTSRAVASLMPNSSFT